MYVRWHMPGLDDLGRDFAAAHRGPVFAWLSPASLQKWVAPMSSVCSNLVWFGRMLYDMFCCTQVLGPCCAATGACRAVGNEGLQSVVFSLLKL